MASVRVPGTKKKQRTVAKKPATKKPVAKKPAPKKPTKTSRGTRSR